jgi:hypothetical protein
MQSKQLLAFGIILLLAACGQDASFLQVEDTDRKKNEGTEPNYAEDADALGQEGENGSGDNGIVVGDEGNPEELEGDEEGEAPSLPPEDYDIPDADDGDLDALHKCMAKWKNLPFDQTIDNYNKIAASVTVGGFGNAINDTEPTDEPWLTLITAGVNVGGAPTYRLLNPNGYYCIKVNVNVLTNLTIELHCNARLADSKVNVAVISEQDDATAEVGVHVLSDIDVVTVRPSGDACIR